MKISTLVLLVVISACTANDINTYIGWYRTAHGGGALPYDAGLEERAKQGVYAICNYGLDHHPGYETEYASLYVDAQPCDVKGDSKVNALKEWYKECPNYYGEEDLSNFLNYGHFTHMVWNSVTKYGMWAQTCLVPGQPCPSSGCCAVVLKTDKDSQWNVPGQFNQNIKNVGNCANVETPWGRR